MTAYGAQKHEPKTMKAKADLMLKRGSISEAQHKKLHAKADVEIGKAKANPVPFKAKLADTPVKTPLSGKGAGGDAGSDKEVGSDTPEADDPSATTRKPGKANVTRGEPPDPDL